MRVLGKGSGFFFSKKKGNGNFFYIEQSACAVVDDAGGVNARHRKSMQSRHSAFPEKGSKDEVDRQL
jgi:hypothetical protein